MPRTVYIKTYGCQMNVYDSDRMADLLAAQGWVRAEAPERADLVVLNTCHIREKAAEKVYSDLGRLQRLRRAEQERTGRSMLLAVAGCVAQAEGAAMARRAPFVDIIVGPQTYHRLPELIARRGRGLGAVVDTDFPIESKFDELPEAGAPPGVAAFLSIQEGCDKFCTFCVVPYTRGAEQSRPVADVLAEARRLVSAGARELTLLGQNVNAYHGAARDGSSWGLGRLIRALAELPDLARIRYTTSHPRDMDEELIVAHGEVPQLMPFLHLPVQSGSDRVLEAMNRRHTVRDYRRVVDRLREARPDLALSSDFIVGFPGEDEEDFRATLDLVRAVGFAQSFSFKYSGRPGTPATMMRRQVKDETKSRRLHELQALLDSQSRAFNEATVGTTCPVLLERPGRHPGQLVGRSPWLQAVHVEAPGLETGAIVEVEITACHSHSLAGALPGVPAQRKEAVA
ncbi:MAG TPA: tRNA (N6-isopentenyl adenosine(37)-C2)-methylthiotransferase MiaB [Geminicoccaceae bacterium]|nr:tRNA (N6-isopentenyl adenosine(37)-C2)-methylthiotransferase MiaB [Geminicoccaceae bacterium]